MCFVNYSKAFDFVNWRSLWRLLAEIGVPKHLIAMPHGLYSGRIDQSMSKSFCFGKGVRQGYILSPILFSAYGVYIMRQTLDDWSGSVCIGRSKITNLRYAENTTLGAASEFQMDILLEKNESVSSRLGLTINKSKPKIMVIDRGNQMARSTYRNWRTFIYLGANICSNGSCEGDVRRRIGIAKSAMSQLHRTWRDKKYLLKPK